MQRAEPEASVPGESAGSAAGIPRPIALIIGGAISAAVIAAVLWPSLPFDQARRQVGGPTRVGVVAEQIENEGAAGRISAPAPDFAWVAPDGARRTLGSLRGRSVVVNFWATWCVPCRTEMPLLEQTAAAHPEITFLAVDLDEDGGKIRAFFDELGLQRLEPLLDVGLATTRRYGVLSLPTTFFVGPDGVVRHVQVGEMDQEKLARGIERAK